MSDTKALAVGGVRKASVGLSCFSMYHRCSIRLGSGSVWRLEPSGFSSDSRESSTLLKEPLLITVPLPWGGTLSLQLCVGVPGPNIFQQNIITSPVIGHNVVTDWCLLSLLVKITCGVILCLFEEDSSLFLSYQRGLSSYFADEGIWRLIVRHALRPKYLTFYFIEKIVLFSMFPWLEWSNLVHFLLSGNLFLCMKRIRATGKNIRLFWPLMGVFVGIVTKNAKLWDQKSEFRDTSLNTENKKSESKSKFNKWFLQWLLFSSVLLSLSHITYSMHFKTGRIQAVAAFCLIGC